MNDEQRTQQLRRAADALMEKITLWVQQLEPQKATPQELRQLCGTLKDIKDLCREMEPPAQEGFTVRIEGGEKSWQN